MVLSDGFDFVLDPVGEFNPLDDVWQEVLAVEFALILLGRQHQLAGHGQCGLAAQAAFALDGSVADGSKGAFDRIAGPDVLPMLGREVIECQLVGTVLGQAFDSPVVFHAASLDQRIEGGVGLGLGFSHLSPGRA
jgi:hypothetical protein